MKRGKRRCLKVLVVLFVGGLVLRMLLPVIIVGVVNGVLGRTLTSEFRLGNVDLSILGGSFKAESLEIQDDLIDSERPLLRAGTFSADIKPLTLLGDQLVVEEVILSDVELNLFRDTNGVLNVTEVVRPVEKKETQAEASTDSDLFPLLVQRVRMSNIVVRYRDEALVPEKPVALHIDNLVVDLRDLYFAQGPEGDVLPGRAIVLVTINQGKEVPPAYIGVRAAIGVLGEEVPAVNAIFRLSGLYLTTLGGLVPRGSATALGGGQVDSSIQLQLSSDMLAVKGETVTKGSSYKLVIEGTLAEPDVKKSGLLFSLVSSTIGRGIGGVVNVGKAGVEAGTGVVKGGLEVVKGGGKTVLDAGKGLLGTAGKVVRLDVKGAASNLVGVGKGVAKNVGDTAVNTGSAVGEGLSKAGRTAVGMADSAKWSSEQRLRWREQWQQDAENLDAMSYPRRAKD